MRIAHVSFTDLGGGAGIGAYRLHTGLRRLGHVSRMLVASRHGDDPDVVAFVPPRDLAHRLAARARLLWLDATFKRPYRRLRRPGHGGLTDCRTPHTAALVRQLPTADVVHLHWVAFLLDWASFFRHLPSSIPVVWTLRDENPFTGGCHYAGDCDGFTRRCGQCPGLTVPGPDDLSHAGWRRKHRALEHLGPHRLHVVAPSHWLARRAAASTLLGRFSISTIPNGVDVERFAPGPRAAARAALEVPDDGRSIVLFVASHLGTRRKGFATLLDALEALPAATPVRLLSVGQDSGTNPVRVPHVNLGTLTADSDRLPLAYAAADVAVVPSLEDNLPHTALEALACGVPLVASNVGGLPDLISPGVNGLLVEPGDVGALAAALTTLITDPGRRAAMGRAARQLVVEAYSLERIAARHAELYRTLAQAP
jgi:glycosyltransferase involved in cell wall biosynthesis